MIIESAVLCLALNIFHEARGELIPGQYAVAQVTMNRAGGKQRNICREVYKPRAFSWTHQKVRFKHPSKTNPHAWQTAQRIARIVIAGNVNVDLSRGATHYHATHVRPDWSKSPQLVRTRRIGNHIFYKEA